MAEDYTESLKLGEKPDSVIFNDSTLRGASISAKSLH